MSTVATEPSIGGLLRAARLPRREAELLLASVLGCERSYLIAHAEEALAPAKGRFVEERFARRSSGEPIAYLIGRREFYGVELQVTPDVLIPRPETELLVDLARERAAPGARVLELGTGSGAIAIALSLARPDLAIVASDVSEAALTVARANACEHGAAIEFVRSDWFEALGSESFDLIVANPPYVAENDPHLDQGDVRFEPRLALVGGEDGLDCIRTIAAQARRHLLPGGWLLLEHGYDRGNQCIELLSHFGYIEVEGFRDLARLPRACAGRSALTGAGTVR